MNSEASTASALDEYKKRAQLTLKKANRDVANLTAECAQLREQNQSLKEKNKENVRTCIEIVYSFLFFLKLLSYLESVTRVASSGVTMGASSATSRGDDCPSTARSLRTQTGISGKRARKTAIVV